MLLLIDPDVFEAALNNNKECDQVLNWVANHLFKYEFAVDSQDQIYKKYGEIRDGQTKKSVAVTVLEDIISQIETAKEEKRRARKEGEAKAKRKRAMVPKSKPKRKARPKSSSRIKFLRSTCSDEIQTLLNKRGCKSPMEQLLICMSTHAPKRGLTLVLTNPQNKFPRKLHKPRFKTEICRVIPKLTVVYASDSQIAYPSLATQSKDDTDRLFEKMAEYVIREHYDCPHCYPHTPAPVDQEAGEVDIYGYEREEQASDVIRIWVGECKLRRLSEEKLITTSEVRQLANKCRSIKAYEEKLRRGAVEIHSFMISNAKDMEADAWQEAAKLKNFRFISTRLINNWQNRSDWRIIEVEELEPERVGSSFMGKRLKIFNLETKS